MRSRSSTREDQATEEEREAPLLLRNKPGRRAVSSDFGRSSGPVAGLLLFARRPGRYAPGLAWAARVGLGRPNSAADALFLPTSSGPQGRWVGF